MSAETTVATPLAERPREEQELVRGLIRGAQPKELAWTVGGASDAVLDRAHEALAALAPMLASAIDDDVRRRVGEYLLDRQSPGQAAGSYELLGRDGDARRWALAVREALGDAYGSGEPPALPGVDGSRDPVARTRRGGRAAAAEQRRRDARSSRRTRAEVRAAAAIAASPFREEAVDAQREAEGRVRLPHYASRPTRVALQALVAVLVLGLVYCCVAKVPTYSSGRVLVADLKADAPSDETGLTMIAVFPSDKDGKIHTGQRLQVTLPDAEDAVGSRIEWVSDGVLSPAEIERRFGLSRVQANRVRGPSVVAVAKLRRPDGSDEDRSSFEGAVTDDAHVRTGSTRVIGLL